MVYSVTNTFASIFACALILGCVAPSLAENSCPVGVTRSSQKVDGIEVEAQGCQRQGDNLQCDLALKALEKDNEKALLISRQIRLTDTAGKSYLADKLERAYSQDGARVRRSGIVMPLPLKKSIPVKFAVVFLGVSSSSAGIGSLEVLVMREDATSPRLEAKLCNLKIL